MCYHDPRWLLHGPGVSSRIYAMDVPLNSDLTEFIRNEVRSGRYASEEAVVEAALESFRDHEAPSPDALIDHEFVAYCAREGDDRITIEDVLRGTSTIPGSMAQAIIDEERADRI